MSEYLLQHGSRQTPQTEPMRPDQVENSSGGFVWEIDKWGRLGRFLLLGSEGPTYYSTEKAATLENIQCVRECIREDGQRLVREVVQISQAGRAPKNDPALYALAAAISLGDKQTKRAAAEALPLVARIGTHLYHFVAYAETMRGWGRTMRWAVSNWYAQNPEQLAYQAVKYRSRDGWSHRDLLRLAHPKNDSEHNAIFDWICHGAGSRFSSSTEDSWVVSKQEIINGFEGAQRSQSAKQTAALVRQYNLPREALLSEHLNDVVVWEALLESKMPMNAMVRNLATMTRNGVLDSREHLDIVLGALGSQEAIKKSRLHPMALLIGLRTYASGHGFRGSNTWAPKADVIDALDAAFYISFDFVEPTGKSHLLAIDISGSMDSGYVAGSNLTPREAAAAMALVTLHAEEDVEVVGFHAGPGGLDFGQSKRWAHYSLRDALTPIGLSRRQRLDDVIRVMQDLPMGGTDCALPFLYATQLGKRYEAFVTYSDSETWAGEIHPKQALDQYRQTSGINAKSIVVGLVSNGFTIADPNDGGQLDVVGFDAAAPAVMADFIR